ncbi:MAG: DUF1640 domain-containing protein [Magnetococcales bacterium]|nr:DUF1640 domain-containing protein [Magnetococcales bacterium]
MTATFDTLKFVRRLRDAGVEEKQAEAFSEVFKEAQDAQLRELATKGDLRELEAKLENKLEKELAPIRMDLAVIKWMLALIIVVTVLPILKTLLG